MLLQLKKTVQASIFIAQFWFVLQKSAFVEKSCTKGGQKINPCFLQKEFLDRLDPLIVQLFVIVATYNISKFIM